MNIPVFDAHCDTIMEAQIRNCGLRENKLHVDLKRGMKFSPYAQVFAVFTRPGGFTADMDYSKDHPADILSKIGGELLTALLREFEKNSDILSLCKSTADIRTAEEKGKIAALVAIEGAELIGCDLFELERAYNKGVRLINLCWNYDNALCGAANGPTKSGLTKRGEQYVRKMQELGVVVDLSHASEHTFWDVAEITRRPIIAGHSNSKTVCGSPRNLTDEQFKELIRLHGVAGLNLCQDFLNDSGKADISDIIAHAEHFLALGGEKAVCLGGDLDGIEKPPKGITGIESYGEIYEAMLRRNYPETLVRDIFYNNLFDVLEAAL
ncbi:MAG: membrane dipeptidase [Clostridia bacterium]|nr:membrane dipeptidase [Clostridia bacterium]